MHLIINHFCGLFLFSLLFGVCSCSPNANEDDERVHVLDKKYISESELFALNKAIDEDPENPEIFFRRAKVYFGRKENGKALQDIQTAIKLNSSTGKYFLLKSFIYHNLNKIDSALFAAQTAERLNIHSAEIKILLARLNLESGNKEMADRYMSEAISMTPEDAEVYYLKGKKSAIDGDTLNAVSSFYKAIHKDTNLTDAYKELAGISFNKKKYDTSLVFIALGKISDNKEPYFDYLEGKVLENLNYRSASRVLYLKSLQMDSTYANAYGALGNLVRSEGKDMEAIGYYEKQLKFTPANISTNIILSQLYEKMQRGDMAIPLLERVVKLDTTNKNAKATLEKLYIAYPDMKPKPLTDTTKVKPTVKDTLKPMVTTPTGVKKDTVKKVVPPAVKPQDKPKKESAPRFKIKNPDSTKIETRPDSLK